MSHQDEMVAALKQLGVLCSKTDVTLGGYINLIDLGNTANGSSLFLRTYSDHHDVVLLEVEENAVGDRVRIKESAYPIEGLIYVLGSRGVQYNPVKAYQASNQSDSLQHRVESAFNKSLHNTSSTVQIANRLRDAFIAIISNPTNAEIERQLQKLEA